jgi:hypothetical protein
MHVSYLVLGGGITGRMIKRILPDAEVLEGRLKPKTPNARDINQGFGTNYFWEPIPIFQTKPMKIVTRIDDLFPTEDSIRRYKNKIGKGDEKVSDWGLQFQPESTGYFLNELPNEEIAYCHRIVHINLMDKIVNTEFSTGKPDEYSTVTFTYSHLFNTLPLKDFLVLAGLDHKYPVNTLFKSRAVYVRIVPKPPEAPFNDNFIYVNYLSNPLIEPYRFCDRFGERHYESLMPIGFPHKKLYPGKIWAAPEIEDILHDLSIQNVHCFGRYGRWNPNELLHETYKEIVSWKP